MSKKKRIKLALKIQEEWDVFPIKKLPQTVFKEILCYLSLGSKRELRLVSRWLSEKVVEMDKSFRTFKRISLTNHLVESLNKELSITKSKNSYAQNRLKLSFHIVIRNNSNYKDMVKFLSTWRHEIYKLKITVKDADMFLMEKSLVFPNLEYFEMNLTAIEQPVMTTLLVATIIDRHSCSLEEIHLDMINNLSLWCVELPKLTHLNLGYCDKVTSLTLIKCSSESLVQLKCTNWVFSDSIVDCKFIKLEYLSIFNNHFQSQFNIETLREISFQLVGLRIHQLNTQGLKEFDFTSLKFLWIDQPHDMPLNCPNLECLIVAPVHILVPDYNVDDGLVHVPKGLTNLQVLIVRKEDWWTNRILSKNVDSLRVVGVPNREECLLWDLPSRLNYDEPKIISTMENRIYWISWFYDYMVKQEDPLYNRMIGINQDSNLNCLNEMFGILRRKNFFL